MTFFETAFTDKALLIGTFLLTLALLIYKHAREAEEVVVRKEANERVETVRGTVRETKVDVDREPADGPTDVGGTVPSNRNP